MKVFCSNDNENEKWVSMKELMEHLGASREAILQWINRYDDFPAIKLGKLWKFKLTEVDAWLKNGGADERKK